ncbi:hypothetical protein [Nioella nitratireducens]|uniref:hypothetical protein n=1 Tax=Nioella nitratireducens TaxID=1287720 RepID=UPI0008FD609C|nr:hypothetical protein [Nioella nitratireducens]
MDPDALTIMLGAGALGIAIGWGFGRFAGGGWLLVACLVVAAVAAGLMSNTVLAALGVSGDRWAYLGYAAVAFVGLLPGLAGMVLGGGFGLWFASRAARRTGEV